MANKYIIDAMSKDYSSKIIFGSSNNNLEGLLSKGENHFKFFIYSLNFSIKKIKRMGYPENIGGYFRSRKQLLPKQGIKTSFKIQNLIK